MTRLVLLFLRAFGPEATGLRPLAPVLLIGALGCAAAPHTRAAGAVATLVVQPVAWNPASAPITGVRAVAESGDVVCVFTDEGASILSAKAVVARDDRAKGWTQASTIWSTDGTTPWLVGIDGVGHVQRLRGMNAFEDVTARYGLEGKKVRGATSTGVGTVGFLLDGQLALGAASKIALYPTSTATTISGGGGFVATVGKDRIDLVNTTNAIVTRFDLPGATGAAIDARGRLFASTPRAVYVADGMGALDLVYDAGHDGVHDLVASDDRVWFGDRGELAIVDGARVSETASLGLSAKAKLQPASRGDVWVIDGGKLLRFSAPGGLTERATWASLVAPVFARSCASCHQPNGMSGIDLSTEAAWKQKRALVRERVLVERTMPPKGHTLSEADRAAVRSWVDASR